ncbi:MAG: NnrU family protein [Chromatiales bacterium]|jgi:uncharacterized membrane protein|nr:NnrU family protein [Chromatiales bacterium]
MTFLIIGLVIFIGVHSVSIINEQWRDGVAARIGLGPWKGLYALTSLAGFALLVYGYGEARLAPTVLYIPPEWMRHLALLLLVPVFPLFVATSLPGRIKSAAKHPTLLATKLWAVAHLLVNGMLADVVLFGAILAWAIAGRISMKRRTQRAIPGAPPSKANDAIAVFVGLGLYVAFIFFAHAWLIGVAPINLG